MERLNRSLFSYLETQLQSPNLRGIEIENITLKVTSVRGYTCNFWKLFTNCVINICSFSQRTLKIKGYIFEILKLDQGYSNTSFNVNFANHGDAVKTMKYHYLSKTLFICHVFYSFFFTCILFLKLVSTDIKVSVN